MPVRHSVVSLRTTAILSIGRQFGLICYGCRSSSDLNKLLETEGYLRVTSPLSTWPASLLEDMTSIICQKKCSHYFLHVLIQPQVRNIEIQPGTVHYAIAFLQVNYCIIFTTKIEKKNVVDENTHFRAAGQM